MPQDQYPHFESGSHSALYRQIGNFCVNYTEGLLISLLHLELDDSLPQPVAVYTPLQQKIVTRERTVRHAFQFQTEKLFTDFKSIRRTRLHANRSSDWHSLGVTGQQASSIQLRIEQITAHYQRKHERTLLNFDRRLKLLVHRTDELQDDNPLSPQNLCQAFLSSVDTLGFSSKQTIALLDLFDRVLGHHLDDLYHQLDLGMYNLDILPELTDIRNLAREQQAVSETVAARNEQLKASASDPDQLAGEPEQLATDAPVAQVGNHAPAANDASIEAAIEKERLEKNREAISERLNDLGSQTKAGTLEYRLLFDQFVASVEDLVEARQLQDIKQFVGFFCGLLDNDRITVPLKFQLSRLAQPLIKLVLADPFFFRSSSHPVNDFLHSIIDFEIRYPQSEKRLDFLGDLLDGFLDNKDFSLDEFEPLIKLYETLKTRHITREKEQKAAYRQQQEKNKQEILKLINELTAKLVVEEDTLEFFYDDWQLLLQQLARKIGMDSDAFAQAVEIARILAWHLSEIKPKNTEYERHSFAALLRAVEKGLQSMHFSTAHRNRVRKVLIREFKQQNQQQAVFNKTPSTQQQLQDTADRFSDTINNQAIDLAGINRKQDEQGNAALINFLNNLVIGSWVEIKNSHKERFQRGKLKWKAQDNSLFIFIDRRGHKISECSLQQLKAYFNEEMVRLLSTPGSSREKKPTLGHGYRVFQ